MTTIDRADRPTLADMTNQERAACQWAQCEVKGVRRRLIISYPGGPGEPVGVLLPYGHLIDRDPRDVTPRPDLPRMAWPNNEEEA